MIKVTDLRYKNMTSLDTETRFAAPDSDIERAWSPETDSQEETRAAMAHRAIEDVAAWLANSPNNAGYLTSPAYTEPKQWLDEHADAIEAKLVYDLDDLSLDNADVDLWHLDMIRSKSIPYHNQFNDRIDTLEPIYTTADFMNAGIEDVLRQARDIDPQTPIEEIDRYTTNAVGAMLIRGIYFQELSTANPERFTQQECDTYLRLFQQNVISAIRNAAHLTARSKDVASEQAPAQEINISH